MKPDELLYVAYKNMIFANIKSGFLGQHISDADFYVFNKYPDLFLEVLDLYQEKHSTGGLIDKFYTLNPERIKDISFSKEVFKRLVDRNDFNVLKQKIGEKVFADDIPLIKEVVKRVGGLLINHYGFETLQENEKLRESLYDLDNFSLIWFNLPAPNDDELIKSTLKKDFHSYRKLSEEQKQNKEYIILALEKSLDLKNNGNATVNLYEHIPLEMKTDKDIALLAAQGKCIKQPRGAFLHDNVLKTLLKSLYVKNNSSNNYNREVFNLSNLEGLDFNIFEKKSNIESLFNWLDEEKSNIKKDHSNYGIVHKLLKALAKADPYIKEQFYAKDSLWNQGNIGETKYKESRFFDKFFMEAIPTINNEFTYYMKAYNLRNELNKKEDKPKERKMKI